MPSVLIVGGASDIARELCHVYAKNHFNLVLAARNVERLEPDKADYTLRYNVDVSLLELDITDYWSHEKALKSHLEQCDGLILAAGYLGDHEGAKTDWDECQRIIDTNFTGAVSVLNIAAQCFEKRKSGWIVAISSVAGDRGRASNYFYGSAKAGLSAYLSGLRNRLYSAQVSVLTVKPGFVATKMIEHLPPTPKAITASPQQVAKDIFKAQQKRKNTLYTVWPWRYIMLTIKHIPEFMFKKMKL